MIEQPGFIDTHEFIDNAFLDRILAPYRPSCRYLKRAAYNPAANADAFEVWGELSIPESWYIQSTGHFNAVEFVLCFNQLGYTLMAEAARQGKFPLSIDSFFRQQLPNVVIVEISSEFTKPINAARFFGHVRMKSIGQKRSRVFFGADIEYFDGAGGFARGEVLASCFAGPLLQ